MTNAEIAAALEELGVLYELDGADKFRVLAYGTAGNAIRESPVSVAELAAKGRATEIPGVGKTLAEKIDALLATGEIPAAAKLKAKFPSTLIAVTRVPGLGTKTARRLFEELGVATLEDLKEAAETEKIRDLKGLGPKVEENVLASLEGLGEPGEGPGRILLSKVRPIAEELAAALREHPAANRVEVAGSARRWAETCKDIDLIATADEPLRLSEHLAAHPLIAAAGKPGPNGLRAQTHNGVSVDLRIVAPAAFGNLLQHFTGSKAHNVQLREEAVGRGLSVSEHGITDTETGKVDLCETEQGVYERLGYAYIEPELREGRGELKAAREGKLPRADRARRHQGRPPLPHHPLRRPQLARGDGRGRPRSRLRLHGDHRPLGQPRLRRPRHRRAAVAADRGDRRVEQRQEADSACSPARRSTSASTATSTTPTTWSRRWTGSSPASTPPSRSPPKAMTERVLAAIENPQVDCIGHLTGRLIGRREPYGIDVEAVAEAAARTGTMIEINANPNRRDLSDRHARLAVDAGVTIVINTDAHGVDTLDNMAYGVATARRAWLTKADVANTRGWREFKKLAVL